MKNEHKIILPEGSSDILQFAGHEFALFFREAAGRTLSLITDGDFNGGYFISIGNTSVLKNSGFSYDKNYGRDGVNIFCKDGNLYIIGGSEQACCYGVYVYFEKVFNLKIFTESLWSIEKNGEYDFKDFSISEKPDVPYRMIARYDLEDGPLEQMMRFRTGDRWKLWATYGHTFYYVIPVEKYYNEHPEWFSTYNNEKRKPEGEWDWQACVTNEAFREEYVERLKDYIREYPEAIYVSVSQNDGGQTPCKCPKCMESYRRNRNNWSGVYIEFANYVARKITKWLNEEMPERADKMRFSLLSYGITSFPPVGDGEEEPYAKCDDNVAVFFAPIIGNRATAYTDETQYVDFGDWEIGNRKTGRWLKGWLKCAKIVDIWSYAVDYCNYLQPYNMWNTVKENLVEFKDRNGQLYFEESTHKEPMTNFGDLKRYVESRLMWDTSLNLNELVTDFMKAYYGIAGWKKIYEYFNLMNRHFEETCNPLDFGKIADSHLGAVDKEHFPRLFLETCYRLFDEAVAENENLKIEVRYEFYKDNIKTEQIVINYLLLKLYSDDLSQTEWKKYLDEFEFYGKKKGLRNLGAVGTFESELNKFKRKKSLEDGQTINL